MVVFPDPLVVRLWALDQMLTVTPDFALEGSNIKKQD